MKIKRADVLETQNGKLIHSEKVRESITKKYLKIVE